MIESISEIEIREQAIYQQIEPGGDWLTARLLATLCSLVCNAFADKGNTVKPEQILRYCAQGEFDLTPELFWQPEDQMKAAMSSLG